MQTTLKQTEPLPTLSLVSSVTKVERQEVPAIWSIAYPMLEPAIERTNGRLDEATVFKSLLTGELVLWVIFKGGPIGSLVTQVFTWPSGLKVARYLLAGGKDHTDWLSNSPVIEAWVKEQGCTILEAWGRPGWEKSLTKEDGWRRSGVEMEKKIG